MAEYNPARAGSRGVGNPNTHISIFYHECFDNQIKLPTLKHSF